jgi:hypothetical protein
MQRDNEYDGQQQQQQQVIDDDRQAIREQLIRAVNLHDEEVLAWNSRQEVKDEIHVRSANINNTSGYHSGNLRHQLVSIQMVDQADWDDLFGGEYAELVPDELHTYAARLIHEANHSNLCVEHLEVALLINVNVNDDGIDDAIFFIYVNPHQAFRYGHMVRYDLYPDSEQYARIGAIFDLSGNAIITECTEYDMLGLLAERDQVNCLMQEVFMPGVRSRLYALPPQEVPDHPCCGITRDLLLLPNRDEAVAEAEQDEAEDEEQIAIPPPPPVNDFGRIYQDVIMEYDDEDDNPNEYRERVLERGVENIQMWNNIRNNYRPEEHRAPEQIFDNQENIIQYWLENNDRVNEYLALQEERRREAEHDRIRG